MMGYWNHLESLMSFRQKFENRVVPPTSYKLVYKAHAMNTIVLSTMTPTYCSYKPT